MNGFKTIWTQFEMVDNRKNIDIKFKLEENYLILNKNNKLNFNDFKSTVLINARKFFKNNNLEFENLNCICLGRRISNEDELNMAVFEYYCGEDKQDPIIISYNKNMTGGKLSEYIKIKGIGKRKIRYQKNGRPYIIIKGKKLKL